MKTILESRREWAEAHPSVKLWLGRVAEGTGKLYLDFLHRYFEWLQAHGGAYAGKTPGELIELQFNAENKNKYEQLDLLQLWISGLREEGLRVGTLKTMYAAVKSFYAHNRAALPRDARFTLRSETPPVEGKLDVEGLKKIIESSNTTYRAVFLIMFQGAMGGAEFEHFNLNGWEEIMPQLKTDKPVRISLPGRKHGGSYRRRKFYTYIGRDAKQALLKYLSEKRGPIKKGDPIILNEKGNPLRKKDVVRYFNRHGVLAGIIEQATPRCPRCQGKTRKVRKRVNGKQKVFYRCNQCNAEYEAADPKLGDFAKKALTSRYGVNPHELRDVYRSEWEISPAKGKVAEFMMGHDIDPNDYNKFFRDHEFTMREYQKAEPYLNIMSEDPRVVSVYDVTEMRAELATVREENKRLKERLNGLLSMPVHRNIRELQEEKAGLEDRLGQVEAGILKLEALEAEVLKLKETIEKLLLHSYEAINR